VSRILTFPLVLSLLLSALAVRADTIIVHPDVPIDHLSANELRSIFSMRSLRWVNGVPIRVFVLSDQSPVHKSFVKQKLEMFPYQLRMTWDRAVFSGTGYPPRKVLNVEDMVSRVRSTKGGIGYVNDESIPLLEGVKIVEIN